MCEYSRIINGEVVDVCILRGGGGCVCVLRGGGGCVHVCVLTHHKQGGGGCVCTHAS